jgi:hypothetical protein
MDYNFTKINPFRGENLMSFADGWSAIQLEMPPRVPHTEYSVDSHWDVVRAITGIEVGPQSTPDEQKKASLAFMKANNYDFRWNTLLHTQPFGNYRTRMGHAEYTVDGADADTDIQCPFKSPEEVLHFDFTRAYGVPDRQEWKRRFEDHYQQSCMETPDMVNMTGIYSTAVSGMLEIFGWEMLLMAAGTDLAEFGDLTDRYAAWVMPFFEALAESNVPVVMVHDDIVWSSGPIFSPPYYRSFVFPNYKRFFAPLREAGKKILYTSDGNYTQFIDDIASCGVHGFVMEPATDMSYIAEKYGKTHVFVGNADTRVLLSGSRADIRAEVERCMTIGKQYPGFFFSTGNLIPNNTPAENILYYFEVYEALSKR